MNSKAPDSYRGLFNYLCRSPTVVKQQTLQMKKKSTQFDKFAKKKSNAAIKEQFKQEKRKLKKEREEYFDKKREEVRKQKTEEVRHKVQGTRYKTEDASMSQLTSKQKQPAAVIASGAKQNQQQSSGTQHPGSRNQKPVSGTQQPEPLMPLNKFLAHSGISGRREAAEIVKQGKVKVNNVLITEPGHKVSAKDEVRVNGKKIFLLKTLSTFYSISPKTILLQPRIRREEKQF